MAKDWSKKLSNCKNCDKELLKRQMIYCCNECKLEDIAKNNPNKQHKLTNCKSCDKELGKRQMVYCSNKCKSSDPDNIKLRTSKKEKQDGSKLIRCIHTGQTFNDLKNYSGILTKHIENLSIDSYNCKSNLFDNFEIIDNPDFLKPKYHCKYCNWVTIDVDNKSGCITSHLESNHDILPTDHIINFPEDERFWNYTHSEELRNYFLGDDNDKFIECEICHKKFKKLSNTHLKNHGITEDEYRQKYNVTHLSSKNTIDKHIVNYENVFDKYCRKDFSSKAELEIKSFLEENGITIHIKNRKLVKLIEIDLFAPDYNIAIEFNGLYFHSEFVGKKLKDYHINKTNKCAEIGIRLIHIFEDEWINKKDIVKSRLLHIFNINKERLYARKCILKEISSIEKNIFLNSNHIQGEDKCKVSIGLFNDDKLVSVMTFSNLRKALGYNSNNNEEYELSRFCSSINVVGGASKMFNYFIKKYNPSKIISYADKRWSSLIDDTVYIKLGFNRMKDTKPNYWYMKSHKKRLHRFNFTKNRIVNELGGNPELTEFENMHLLGYDRIWDCGSLKYEMILR